MVIETRGELPWKDSIEDEEQKARCRVPEIHPRKISSERDQEGAEKGKPIGRVGWHRN